MPNGTLCYRFKKINKDSVVFLKELVKGGYFIIDDAAKVERLQALASAVSAYYNIPAVTLVLDPELPLPFSMYNRETKEIVIRKPSIITVLHELRRHMNYEKGTQFSSPYEQQVDCQAWATSFYCLACPKSFRKAVEDGKVMGLCVIEGKISNLN